MVAWLVSSRFACDARGMTPRAHPLRLDVRRLAWICSTRVSGGLPDSLWRSAGDRRDQPIGFRRIVSEVGGAVGGRRYLGQHAGGLGCFRPRVLAPTMRSCRSVALRPCPRRSGGSSPEGWPPISTGPTDHAGAQRGRAAKRCGSSCFSRRAEMPSGSPSGRRPRTKSGTSRIVPAVRGLPAAAGALEGVCFSAQRPSLFRTDEACISIEARRRRRHRPPTCADGC